MSDTRPCVYAVQPILEVDTDILREVADVEVYPYTERQITVDELAVASEATSTVCLSESFTLPVSC